MKTKNRQPTRHILFINNISTHSTLYLFETLQSIGNFEFVNNFVMFTPLINNGKRLWIHTIFVKMESDFSNLELVDESISVNF